MSDYSVINANHKERGERVRCKYYRDLQRKRNKEENTNKKSYWNYKPPTALKTYKTC